MKAAKKRYHKKIPKFWQILKQQKEVIQSRNAWTGLGPFTVKWPEHEPDFIIYDEASEEEISQEDSKVLEDPTRSSET